LTLDLFRPARIAIVGATERPGHAASFQQTLLATGFPGEILPVNPNRNQVFGARAYPSLAAIDGPVDLAVILVATGRVPAVVREAGQSGVRSAVIFSAGFAELGEAGRRAQEEIRAAARETGIRVFGPNCIGFADPLHGVVAMVVARPSVPTGMRAGGAALISQSGGLMISSLEYGSQVGLGFRVLASTGNEADVTCLDVVESVVDEADVRAIGLIAEGIGDGRRLVDLGRRALEQGKRIVALKLGRSRRGAEAVLTHTAVLAGSKRVFDAACRDAGIVQARTIADLVEHLVLLEKPQPRKRRAGGLAAMTISGGTKVMVTDIAEEEGLRLADLQPRTRRQLAGVIPEIGVASNPLDVTAAAIEDADVLRAALRILANDRGVGTVALVMHLRKSGGSENLVAMVRAFCAEQASTDVRLVVVSSIPDGVSGFWREEAATGDVPFLNDLASLRVIRALHEPPPARPHPRVARRSRPPREIAEALRRGDRTLGEAACRRLFEAAGIPVVPGRIADSPEEAVAAAGALGYPVAVKLAGGGVVHKTEIGGVRLGLRDAAAVADAFHEVAAGSGSDPANGKTGGRVLVERMAPDGVELIAGVRQDPQYGPVVTVGLGGVLAEVLDDVRLRLGPIARPTAREMLRELRGRALLEGWRGSAPVALDAAAGAIAGLSRLGASLSPWVDSIEINPLLVTPEGAMALDGVAVLSAGTNGPSR
jgi:acyl-CoA synthetase (NDP forming)